MDLSERLQRLQQLGLHKGATYVRPPAPRTLRKGLETAVVGDWVSSRYGGLFVSQSTYPLTTQHGDLTLGQSLELPPSAVAACAQDPALEALELRRAAFIDTETSGLSGGTGTFAFLIGIGMFDHKTFTVRQFFMPTPADELALLHAVGETLDKCTGLVSYNGRAFDLPLLNTRFLLNRQLPPMTDAPHLDLLFPTRRLLRLRLGSCTLGNVERQALNVQRREADVPGWLIPTLYRQYLQSGDASELSRIFYHNLEDIVSLVTLSAYLCRHFISGESPSVFLDTIPPVERISLGQAYDQLRWTSASEATYRQALADSLSPDQRDQALHRLSFLLKRQGRRAEAAELWRTWAEQEPSRAHLVPHVELAKHHEWHDKDLSRAVAWTEQAVQIAAGWPTSAAQERMLAELQHRLNRLRRRLVSDTEADNAA